MSELKAHPGISIHAVSKFYGDVLGVNKINLVLEPGITGLVGPNGSGKSTLMNLIAGLMKPTRGEIQVMGCSSSRPEQFYRQLGYCTQFDTFPGKMSGREFVVSSLRLHGYQREVADSMSEAALQRVGMSAEANQRIAGYSKGMRQRIKLAQAISHEPKVLILDEPMNGLDPMARALVIELIQEFASSGACVLISSHILHEVDLISDQIVLLNNGYLVAEGDVEGIQGESGETMQVFVRSVQAAEIASWVFSLASVVEAELHNDGAGLFIRTTDADEFFLTLNKRVLSQGWKIEAVSPANETVEAVYRQFIMKDQVAR